MMREERKIFMKLYEELVKASEETFAEVEEYAKSCAWSSEAIKNSICGIFQEARKQRKSMEVV